MTKITDLKIGQKVWYFSKYGDLESGTILKLTPKHLDNSQTSTAQ